MVKSPKFKTKEVVSKCRIHCLKSILKELLGTISYLRGREYERMTIEEDCTGRDGM